MKRGRLLTRATLLVGIGLSLSHCAVEPVGVGYYPAGYYDGFYGGWGYWNHGWDHSHWDHGGGGEHFAHDGGGGHFGGGGHGGGGHR